MGKYIGSPFEPKKKSPTLVQEIAAALERGMTPKKKPAARKRPSRAKAKA